jgi:hypothetical protein
MTRRTHGRAAPAALLIFALGCPSRVATTPPPRAQSTSSAALLDDVQKRTFLFFWETTNPENGLVPDRWPTPSFSSIAAVGFGLTAYGVGVERGWITREAAAQRVLTTLKFFLSSKQGDAKSGITGYRGFYYHFVDMKRGMRATMMTQYMPSETYPLTADFTKAVLADLAAMAGTKAAA